MKNTTTNTGTLEILERLPNSANGNPRYLCRVDGRNFRTTPDSSYAYTIPNHEGKTVTVRIGMHYGSCQLDALWTDARDAQ